MKKKLIGAWDSIDDYVTTHRRLDLLANGVWECEADPPGAMHRWFNPQMFEQLCVLNPKLEKLLKNYEDTPEYRAKIEEMLKEIEKENLRVIFNKFKLLLPGLVDYFLALYNTGEWESDKKDYQKYPYKGKEPEIVKADRFIV